MCSTAYQNAIAAAAAAVAAARPAPKRKAETCTCKAYGFIHRKGGGKCLGKHHGPFCGACGEPADPKQEDFGYGVTEFWGRVSNHRDVRTVSRCCEAELYEDASLTIEYEP